MMETEFQPKVFVSTYAAYNDGRGLEGKWFDLEGFSDKAEFIEAAEAFVSEADPELMFADYEAIPNGMIGECWIKPEVWDWLKLDDAERAIVTTYRAGVDENASIETALEAYAGTYDSELDWAYEYVDNTGLLSDVSEFVSQYFNYEAFARDARLGGNMLFVSNNASTLDVFYNT